MSLTEFDPLLVASKMSAPSLTIQPELWVSGQKVADGQVIQVGGTVYDLRPYVLVRRTFKDSVEEDAAKADYTALVKANVTPDKAFRLALSDDPSAAPVLAAWKTEQARLKPG